MGSPPQQQQQLRRPSTGSTRGPSDDNRDGDMLTRLCTGRAPVSALPGRLVGLARADSVADATAGTSRVAAASLSRCPTLQAAAIVRRESRGATGCFVNHALRIWIRYVYAAKEYGQYTHEQDRL
ncbi:hypothetical protein MTO96_006827 [Rhipicephalus appendiculatus]